ncbi:MAG: ARMT1-like domain-containing protein [Proteobacteria bacterium]|nr:ARMT1-like domain-containing protein [Pseudomonadota bacterium]
MKAIEYCIDCLSRLAEKTLQLSYGYNRNTYSHCCAIIEKLFKEGKSPPGIANEILRYIKNATGVYDPYVFLKEKELRLARKAFEQLADRFSDSLEGVIKLSALGNSLDFFTDDACGFDMKGFIFSGDMDKIENEIYIKGKDVLILGDNVGDFVFDIPLAEFLESMGKHVYYAVKEHPVQNDLSMPDALKFEFVKLFDNIISTCTDEVGIRLEEMKGKLKDLWETDAVVIAKGMGNYETISEYQSERSVIHIMKVKCPAVSKAAGYKKGTYVAKLC